MTRIRSYLELIRFPNLFSAMADIVAGAWVAVGLSSSSPFSLELAALLLSSAALYAMGIVMNDYFDFELDCKERPERPLPSGRISRSSALSLGAALGLTGVGLAALVNDVSLI
ncbi:MAG: UbiA family prenyltransferase, partial [Novibacillus thermophilus]